MTSTTKTVSAIDYENPWIYNGSPFLSEDINDHFGFVYRITNLESGEGSISDENTSGKNENLEVSLGELHLKATGKNTTDRALNLLLILSDSVRIDLDEKSYHSISLQEKQIMRRLDNSLSMESSLNQDTYYGTLTQEETMLCWFYNSKWMNDSDNQFLNSTLEVLIDKVPREKYRIAQRLFSRPLDTGRNLIYSMLCWFEGKNNVLLSNG